MAAVEKQVFENLCKRHDLTPEEKEAAKQILLLLNGKDYINAKDILRFCDMVLDTSSKVFVDFE